jgi:hypothetical protein
MSRKPSAGSGADAKSSSGTSLRERDARVIANIARLRFSPPLSAVIGPRDIMDHATGCGEIDRMW